MVDKAGNVSEKRTLRFPPSVKITSPKVESNEAIAGVSVEITGPDGMKIKKIEVSGAGNPALTCVNMPSDTHLVTVPFTCDLGDITTTGKLEVIVTSDDNFTGSSEQGYIIDAVKPSLAITSVDAFAQGSANYITKEASTTVIFTATDTGGSTVGVVAECSTDNGASWQVCTSPYTLDLPGAVTTLKVRARDGVGNLSDEKEITVKKDTIPPLFNPTNPAKIIARKGTPIVVDDVTVSDGVGASGINAQGLVITVPPQLDISNPAKGNYTVIYSATDNAGNNTTADREVEITDADDLIAKIALANNPATTQGKTPASIAHLQAKVAA